MSKENKTLNGIGTNPKDPLPKLAPAYTSELLHRFSQAAHNFGMKDVIDAAGSVIITALRQRFATRQEAEAAFDEIHGRMKQALVDHYDGASRRVGTFPYDQHLYPQLVKGTSKIFTN